MSIRKPKFLDTKERTIVIHETSDYDLFEFMPENRKIQKMHVRRQKQSLERFGWLQDQPMQVVQAGTGRWRIVDGQHRFLAAQELGIAVFFIEKFDEDHFQAIQVFHTFNRAWAIHDFLHHWARRGKDYYLYAEAFIENFEMPVGSALAILGGHYRGLKGTTGPKKSSGANSGPSDRELFKSGDWVVSELNKSNALAMAEMAQELYQTFPTMAARRKEGKFVNALFSILSHPDYEQARMLKMLSKNSTLVVECPTCTHYIELLLSIYNKKREEQNRLKLEDDLHPRSRRPDLAAAREEETE